MLRDLELGKGKLNIRMTDTDAFEVGENIAVTPGNPITVDIGIRVASRAWRKWIVALERP